MSSSRKKIVDEIKKFGKETTIHGVFFLVSNRLHLLERSFYNNINLGFKLTLKFYRLFWAIIILAAIISSISLCLSNWNRYSANPTVVSLQKDYRNWNNPFPAATVCFIRKTDDLLVAEYIEKKWGINYTDDKYDYYFEFVKAVANISYQSLDVFKKYENDSDFNDVDMMDLAVKVYPVSDGNLVTFDTKDKTKWIRIMTEMGICSTMNSMFSKILAFREADKVIDSTKQPILKCHFLNGLCYARFDSEPDAPIKFYIHSYFDIVHATITPPWHVKENEEFEINYRMQETVADSSIRSLNPIQRRCRFEDEPSTDEVPYYSSTICYMLCRYRIVRKLCGCKPFFYNNLAGKICDLKGLLCVADHSQYLLQPASKLGCDCPQPCNIIAYLPQSPKITLWESGYFDQRITFRWGLLPPTTKYLRSILFGFEDLVGNFGVLHNLILLINLLPISVSFGGIVALFLGISFISIIETIFFLIRMIFYCLVWIFLKFVSQN
ncbi:amiloride-sensitive sodium channel-related [Holotrichia oblita]|uniref:Amiloride-sensitive sodium channel-related n=1 Tax=Holotrichia oblita TaxID=644536 RepID=A0ACB9SX09_HOLOL|nr:amiloride-sensitive sodium channel-related [Holotrichia oblita]